MIVSPLLDGSTAVLANYVNTIWASLPIFSGRVVQFEA